MRILISLLLAAALLGAVHFCQQHIDGMPEKQELVATNPYGRMPPAQYMAEYTASMLLGGLRAVAIDYLWIQFTKAEKARQWIEVNAILEIILRLQPNSPEIWNHLAWAKAYNIAAQQESADDRWLWVNSGLGDMEEAVKRDPSSEKLLFNKGYMLYHRIPQEQVLMDKYRAMTGRDCYQDAAQTLRGSIELAQSKGRNNTTPPADGMMQDAYFKWAFVEMRRGEYRRAIEVLDEGHDVYIRLMSGRPISDVNEKMTQGFLELDPIFAAEREFARLKAAGKETEQVRAALLEAYVAVEKRYLMIKGAEHRIIELTDGPFAEAFRLAEAGKADQGADLLGRTAIPLYADLTVRADGTENPFWNDAVRLGQVLQAALRLESEGKTDAALKKYEEILSEFRYNLPAEAPQLALIEKHVSGMRGAR